MIRPWNRSIASSCSSYSRHLSQLNALSLSNQKWISKRITQESTDDFRLTQINKGRGRKRKKKPHKQCKTQVKREREKRGLKEIEHIRLLS